MSTRVCPSSSRVFTRTPEGRRVSVRVSSPFCSVLITAPPLVVVSVEPSEPDLSSAFLSSDLLSDSDLPELDGPLLLSSSSEDKTRVRLLAVFVVGTDVLW